MRERERRRERAPVSLLCLLPGNNILHCAANGNHAWRKPSSSKEKKKRRVKKNSIFHGAFWRWHFCLGSIISVWISAQTGVDNEINLKPQYLSMRRHFKWLVLPVCEHTQTYKHTALHLVHTAYIDLCSGNPRDQGIMWLHCSLWVQTFKHGQWRHSKCLASY